MDPEWPQHHPTCNQQPPRSLNLEPVWPLDMSSWTQGSPKTRQLGPKISPKPQIWEPIWRPNPPKLQPRHSHKLEWSQDDPKTLQFHVKIAELEPKWPQDRRPSRSQDSTKPPNLEPTAPNLETNDPKVDVHENLKSNRADSKIILGISKFKIC